MGSWFIEGIQRFKDATNGKIPTQIIVFRDGIGDSQIETAKRVEVETLQQRLLDELQWEGTLVYLSVNKLVNARFFG